MRTTLHTSRGPVVFDPYHYAVIPGSHDVVIAGSGAPEAVVIDVYSGLDVCLRSRQALVRGVDTPEFRECCRVSITIETLRCEGGRNEPLDSSDERLVSRGPEMNTTPEEELAEHGVALDHTI